MNEETEKRIKELEDKVRKLIVTMNAVGISCENCGNYSYSPVKHRLPIQLTNRSDIDWSHYPEFKSHFIEREQGSKETDE